MVPSSSAPPSSGQPGLWRRKSSTGAVDAQGNLLVHPMVRRLISVTFSYGIYSDSHSQTWLDERLFGWTRSAMRGTSAWAGSSPSTEISRTATPDASEDEDGPGDYDNLLGYLEGRGPSSRPRSRSLQNSYADLQKLRKAPNVYLTMTTGTEPQSDGEGLHMRHGARTRKASLSDGVAVERIGELDRQEPFDEATQDLNREIQEKKSSTDPHSHRD